MCSPVYSTGLLVVGVCSRTGLGADSEKYQEKEACEMRFRQIVRREGMARLEKSSLKRQRTVGFLSLSFI